jgi:hypothetical protein
MAKKIIQDIYMVKKSIRMIKKSDVSDGFYSSEKKIPENKNFNNDLVNKIPVENNTYSTDETDDNEYMEEKKHVTKGSLMLLWIICIISIATLLFLMSSMFATATLKITPKSEMISLNDAYNITSDKNVSTSSLHYEVMTIKKDLSKSLVTDGEESVERKATGKAILYNNFSTGNQRLINNTRLETKDGSIYRIRESVDIPGMKTINGVKTPGSIEVDIIAYMPGDKYNMKLSDFKGDFTIPGFQGSTKYTGFYGRLSTDMTGGLIGNVKKVSDDKIQAGRTELQNTLKDGLIKEVYAKNPDQYILFKNSYYLGCNDLADDSSSDGYKITEECSINAIVFNKDVLAAFIASNKIKNFDNSKVDIIWNDNDTVVFSGNTVKPWNETSIKAKFTGLARVVWLYDASGILSSIIGQDKSIINSVIENNKNSLTEIQATIRPMWKNTFPENDKKIKIIDTIRDTIN